MLLRQATILDSLFRVGLGILWLNLPWILATCRIGRLLNPEPGPARGCTHLTVGWVLMLLAFQGLGSLGCLSFTTLGGLFWLLLATVLLLERRVPRMDSSEPRHRSAASVDKHLPVASSPQPEASPPAFSFDSRWMAPVILTLALGLSPWLRQTALPPAMEDTLTYHLSLPAEWLNSGELRTSVQHDADMGPTFYPFAGEVLLGWAILTTGTDMLATGSAWLCLPAMLLAFLAIAAEAGVGPRAAAAGWTLLMASTLTVWLTMVGFNDLPLACAALLALQGALRLRRQGDWRAALEAGLGLGLLASVKYSGLAVGSGIALVAGLAALRHGVRSLLVLLGAAVVCGGYTYLRNWILTGSPLYPAHLELFGQRLATGLYSAADWVGHSHHNFDWRRHLLTVEGIRRIGWPLVSILPLAALGLVLGLVRKPAFGRLALVVGVFGLAAFWGTSPYRHDVRFYVPGVALLVVPALLVLDRLALTLGRLFEPLLVLVVAAVFSVSAFGKPLEALVAVVLALAWQARWKVPGPRVLAGLTLLLALLLAVRQPAYLQNRSANWEKIYEKMRGQVWSALERLSPPEGLTVAASGTSNTYPLYGPDLRNRVVFVPRTGNTGAFVYGFGHPFLPVFEPADPDLWLRSLRELGVQAFVLGPARCPERDWIQARPEVFLLQAKAGGYALYAVAKSP